MLYRYVTMENRFPKFRFSNVARPVNKNLSNNDIHIAIPRGKKYYAWFTFYKTFNVCVFMCSKTGEYFYEKVPYSTLSLGSVLYGTLVEYKTHKRHEKESVSTANHTFFAENVFYYEGLNKEDETIENKLKMLLDIFKNRREYLPKNTQLKMATIWKGANPPEFLNMSKIFQVMKIFVPETTNIMPPAPAIITSSVPAAAPPTNSGKPAQKQQQPQTMIFDVKADIMNDIYYLTPISKKCAITTPQIAFIPDYKTSVFMNKIFRKIKENDNLDLLEESDDEEEFEDTRNDRFVDLEKVVRMNCKYNAKFKKWTPIRE